MNKLDISPHTFTSFPVSHSDPECARRLIVLFPSSETDKPDMEHRIWEIARSLHLNVLLLGLTNDFDEESQLRRKLITMAAVIKDPNVSTDIMIEHGTDWVKLVRKILNEGDIVACYGGQKVGLMHKSLDQVLKSHLDATIYILADYRPTVKQNSNFISRVFSWSGSLAIIGGFFWAEVKIVQMPQDWAHTALTYICVVLEIILLWLWNLLIT